MATIDWHRGDLTHGIYALMVDPGNLTDVRGELHGLTGGRLDLAYYGDTRMGAEITTQGDHGWDGSAAIRLVHTVSDYTGQLLQEPIFTGYVTAASWDGEGDALVTTWTLSGTLHAPEAGVCETGYSVAKGSSALEVIGKICRTLSRPYVVAPRAVEYVLGSNKVYEAGATWLSVLFDLANTSGNRISVDEMGRLVIERYVVPSARGVDWAADERDPRGMVIGPVTGDMGGFEAPDRVVVRAESGDAAVTGMAYAPSGSPQSRGVRGYRLDRFELVSDLSPFTADSARALAQRYMAESSDDLPAVHHGLMYRPMREGMIERLTMRDGTTSRWMVSGASLDLSAWTWTLDLKGGWQ